MAAPHWLSGPSEDYFQIWVKAHRMGAEMEDDWMFATLIVGLLTGEASQAGRRS